MQILDRKITISLQKIADLIVASNELEYLYREIEIVGDSKKEVRIEECIERSTAILEEHGVTAEEIAEFHDLLSVSSDTYDFQ